MLNFCFMNESNFTYFSTVHKLNDSLSVLKLKISDDVFKRSQQAFQLHLVMFVILLVQKSFELS